jgi:5,10-methylenetetrahydromethanopterin reductase
LRHPAATAASAATVHELSGGRCVLGIGTGGDLALGPVGVARDQPFARVVDAIRLIRGVTTASPVEGYEPPPHALPPSDVPIFIGARSERLNRLASSLADGVFLGGIPRGSLPEAAGWARSVRPIDVAVYVNAAFDPAEREHLRGVLLRPLLDGPLSTRARLGIDDAIAAAADRALGSGDDRPARAVVEDRILDEFVLAGDRDDIGRGLADLVVDLRPTSIGLTLHPGDDPIGTVLRGADVLGRARRFAVDAESSLRTDA